MEPHRDRFDDLVATDGRFEGLYREHVEAITRYFLRRLPQPSVADATAEVFLVTWRRWDEVPPDQIVPWMYGVARNIVKETTRVDHRRGRLRKKVAGLAPHRTATDPQQVVLASEEYRDLRQALERLSADDREVIELRAFEELSFEAIAVVLECSPEAARKRLSRALTRLRSALGVGRADGSGRKERRPWTIAN